MSLDDAPVGNLRCLGVSGIRRGLCEYNRMFDKNGKVSEKTAVRFAAGKVDIKDLDAQTAYPDIIVHDRSNGDCNLVILEVSPVT
jgi:hypothetical protein